MRFPNPGFAARATGLALALSATLLAGGCGWGGSGGGAPADPGPADPAVKPAPLVPAGGAEALEKYVRNGLLVTFGAPQPPFRTMDGGPVPAVAGSDALATDAAAPAAASGADGFSTTNLQEAGVDEADTVKFDGSTLFVAEQPDVFYGWIDPLPLPGPLPVALAAPVADPGPAPERPHARVRVLEATADPAGTHEIASIPLPREGTAIDGLYLAPGGGADPDLLVAVGSGDPAPVAWDLWRVPWFWTNGRTNVTAFDVTDPAAASPAWDLELEGHLVASRKVGDVLYLVTRFTPYLPLVLWPATEDEARANREAIASVPLADLLPKRVVDGAPAGPLVAPERCFLPEGTAATDGYPVLVTVTAIDVRDPGSAVSVCLGGATDGIYASPAALYLAGSAWERTVIHKFALDPAGPTYRGSGIVPGNLGWREPRYRMGEKDGVLRVLTTDATGIVPFVHHLTLLAEAGNDAPALKALAHLPNADRPEPIGKPGEDVYAVRFAGDRGYVVTFRRVDPLYVLDLSDPAAPRIAGALEVPGFSDYLHPVGDTLLLGVGRDVPADPKAPTVPLGVKLALFDVADPAAPALVDQVVVGGRGSWTEVAYDPHALAYLAGADGPDRLALPIAVYGDPATPPGGATDFVPWTHTALYLFDLDRSAATLAPAGALVAERPTADKAWPGLLSGDRGVIQGPAVHYVHGGQVWSAPWADPGSAVGPG